MNDLAKRLVMDRMNRDDYRNDASYVGHGTVDYSPQGYDSTDGRRGVYGTGPYGVGGRMHRDRGHGIKLTKRDMMKWKKGMYNADGSYGEKYNLEQIMQHADKMGVKFDTYDEKDLCMTVNMIYSDFCEKAKKYVPADRMLQFCIDFAVAWLEDDDASVEGAEKLALYYCCIVEDE